LALPALVALLAGAAGGVSAQDESTPAGLVTEEVEPGVVRIIRDGAGHDLEERHPTYRYDMDDVFVTPDGTVWLATSYRDTDNEANPPGGLVWALGQSGTPQYPAERFCFPNESSGVTCFDPATETETRYLSATPINAVAAAPDGTFWAVGSHDGSNGGLYHITPE
jgi:sugar lactone lactonase YvrE